ncbi:lipopolysaccharide biosynthesis protein [Streptomyces sp. ISL-10]|uniref:lipopolysaccharide biosynthesis protein n=1 Tax=Streptomyces sp. ISL-10 TaxID=2819172 RepID=UPI001BE6BC85|nr:lipopolysaccharide biosynthesis protein [Streptomyces sp. ISL-10]MBT2364571.1 lipopolysaccharide biosynthesis protein [Streptomyces sp. ISL-10]
MTSAIIARALEPEGRGIYYMAVTVAATATALAQLSVEQAQSALWTDAERREALTGNSVPLALSLGTVGGLAGTACVAMIGPDALHLPGLSIVALACLGVPLGVAVNYANNITLLHGAPHVASRALLARAFVQCGLLLVLAAAGGLSPIAVVLVWVASETVPLLALVVGGGMPVRRPNLRLARTTVITGARYHPGPTAIFLLQYADIILLGAYAGAEDVGIYSLAVILAGYGRILIDALSQVMMNRQLDSNSNESVEVTVRNTRIAILLAVASGLLVVLGAPLIVVAVYGEAFAAAVPLVALLAPGALALGASRMPSTYLLRLRRPLLVVTPSVVALAINIAMNLVLIPEWGAIGCAVACSVSYLLLAAWQTRLFLREARIPARELLPTSADLRVLLTALRRCGPVGRPMPAPSGQPTRGPSSRPGDA